MSNFVVLYDACVLHPSALRNLLMRLALTGLFRAKWTDEIHDEWCRSVLAHGRGATEEKVQRTRKLMNDAIPDSLVVGYKGLADHIHLPDEKDRHVVAAAIKCHAGAIVTYNLKDFPTDALAAYAMTAQHPDEFISHLFDLNRGKVCAAVKEHRQSLKNPPHTTADLLHLYLKLELAQTVASLQTMESLL